MDADHSEQHSQGYLVVLVAAECCVSSSTYADGWPLGQRLFLLVFAIHLEQYDWYLNRLESKKDCGCAKRNLKKAAKWSDHGKICMERECRQRYEAEICREGLLNL